MTYRRFSRTTTRPTHQPPDPDQPLRIRLEGTPADLAEAAARLGEVLDLVEVSATYHNRDPGRRGYGLSRLYLRARLPPRT